MRQYGVGVASGGVSGAIGGGASALCGFTSRDGLCVLLRSGSRLTFVDSRLKKFRLRRAVRIESMFLSADAVLPQRSGKRGWRRYGPRACGRRLQMLSLVCSAEQVCEAVPEGLPRTVFEASRIDPIISGLEPVSIPYSEHRAARFRAPVAVRFLSGHDRNEGLQFRKTRTTKEGVRTMKKVFHLAMLSAFVVIGLAASHLAHADGDSDGWHSGGGCDNWERIGFELATCIDASWDNSSSVFNSYVNYTTKCGTWGTVVMHVDLKAAIDEHLHESDNVIGSMTFLGKIQDVECCIGKSDLCVDQQAKIKNGNILHVTTSGNSWESTVVDVSTPWRKYDFCQENPKYIFCTHRESWIFNEPNTPRCAEDETCNCGDHLCTVDDCDTYWDNNTEMTDLELPAETSCGDSIIGAILRPSPTMTMRARPAPSKRRAPPTQ